MRLRMML